MTTVDHPSGRSGVGARRPGRLLLVGLGPEHGRRIEPERHQQLIEQAGSGLPSGATIRPATRASIWASARAWMAAAVRRAERSTSTLTTPAVTRNMTRARTSRASAMVKVWIGGAK